MTTGPGRPGAWPPAAGVPGPSAPRGPAAPPRLLHAPPGRPPAGSGLRRRRPAVLDAGRVSLIPLRPLTITEILDAAFVVLRGRPRAMLGLPLAIAALVAGYLGVTAGLWYLVATTVGWVALTLVVVASSLLASMLLTLVVAWMTAVISRATVHTALGPGFAPAPAWSWREARALFWPMAGLALLQGVALSIVQSATGVVGYLLLIVSVVSQSTTTMIVTSVLTSLVTLVLYAALSSYVSLTVPAWALEGARTPGWVGKPQRPTTIVTAFGRSVSLVGLRNLPRATAVSAASLGLSLLVAAAVFIALVLMVILYGSVMGLNLTAQLLAHPWILLAAYAATSLVTLAGLVAFNASAQTLLYLDLRMRRDGLDLALRFDDVDPPQPVAPPPPGYLAVAPPPHAPRPAAPQAGSRP